MPSVAVRKWATNLSSETTLSVLRKGLGVCTEWSSTGEQVVGLKLREDTGALAPTVAQDAGDCKLRVVVENALRHSTEEVERSVVPITERLRRLRRICP